MAGTHLVFREAFPVSASLSVSVLVSAREEGVTINHCPLFRFILIIVRGHSDGRQFRQGGDTIDLPFPLGGERRGDLRLHVTIQDTEGSVLSRWTQR